MSLAIDSAGRMLLAGDRAVDGVLRLTDDGVPDPEFGDDGITTVPSRAVTSGSERHEIRMRPDGTILLTHEGAIDALTPDGEPDTGLAGDGTAIVEGLGAIAEAALDPLGRLYFALPPHPDAGPLQISRLGADGSADATFAKVAIGGDGRWSLNAQLHPLIRTQLSLRCGSVHSYTLFTGYMPQRIRGEMRSLEVLPAQ